MRRGNRKGKREGDREREKGRREGEGGLVLVGRECFNLRGVAR